MKRVANFADKHSLDFTLLADSDHDVADGLRHLDGEVDVRQAATSASQRATFIVGPDGKIARVFPKVSPKTHDDVVLEALAELQ